ncbi:MAG TPA: hypothetical protein PLO51_01885 [Candidatus Micrarchaeota archaeon]|nr:hypothetical protein [Candidatus Micrarchaeota archaeon]
MLHLKTISDKPSDSDGYRLLATCEWPKGCPPSFADGFNPNLAPPRALYDSLVSGKAKPDDFTKQYLKHLEAFRPRLEKLAMQAKDFDITLVTYPDCGGFSVGRIVLDKIQSIGKK